MQLHVTGTDPTRTALLVARNSRWGLLVLLAFLWTTPIGFWYVEAPAWIVYVCGSLPALLTVPLLGTWRKRGRDDNWVMAMHRDGLWLNLRSAEYHEAEPSATIVLLPYSEILAARRVVYRYTTPSDHGRTREHRDTFLSLRLRSHIVSELEEAIAAEQRRALPEKTYFGFLTIRTNRTSSLIEVDEGGVLLITYATASVRLTPSIAKALAILREYVTIESDYMPLSANWRDIDGAEFNQLVRRLATSGQQIEAMQLLRFRKGMSATEAKQYLVALHDRSSPASSRNL